MRGEQEFGYTPENPNALTPEAAKGGDHDLGTIEGGKSLEEKLKEAGLEDVEVNG